MNRLTPVFPLSHPSPQFDRPKRTRPGRRGDPAHAEARTPFLRSQVGRQHGMTPRLAVPPPSPVPSATGRDAFRLQQGSLRAQGCWAPAWTASTFPGHCGPLQASLWAGLAAPVEPVQDGASQGSAKAPLCLESCLICSRSLSVCLQKRPQRAALRDVVEQSDLLLWIGRCSFLCSEGGRTEASLASLWEQHKGLLVLSLQLPGGEGSAWRAQTCLL